MGELIEDVSVGYRVAKNMLPYAADGASRLLTICVVVVCCILVFGLIFGIRKSIKEEREKDRKIDYSTLKGKTIEKAWIKSKEGHRVKFELKFSDKTYEIHWADQDSDDWKEYMKYVDK